MHQVPLPMDEPDEKASPPASNTDALLFGADPTPRIVAVEARGTTIRLYQREGDTIRNHEEPFQPWLLSEQAMTLPGVEWETLQGDLGERKGLRYLARCANIEAFENLRRAIRETNWATLVFGSLVRQYLMMTGKTLFKQMAFHELHRLQLDIETTTLRPDQPDAKVLMVALSDNRGYEEVLFGEERTLLTQLAERIHQRDPDVIEGHNLFGFDLPYLAERAKRCRVPLNWGRDGSELRFGSKRACIIGANSRDFVPAFVEGRHLIDTYLAVQRYDIARGALESYGLKEVALQLGFASDGRTYLDRTQIPTLWEQDPDRVREYALDDVRETRQLAELVLPTEFYQCQMVPDTLQNLATIGTGEKANLLFLRAYLHARHTIPQPQPSRDYPGGYTEVREIGLLQHIIKADVESLYPSLMLHYGYKPSADHLNVFLPMLERLRQRRLEAKARAKQTSGLEAEYWDGLQGSFKILINSFYGYLGAPFHFNDYAAAEAITLKGQELVKQIAEEIERQGGKVIEIDTDGVYFQPPAGVNSLEEQYEFVNRVGAILPEGIRLTHDGHYRAMLSIKTKNYVLQDDQGNLIFKGASIRSRADERFGREFLNRAIQWLLQGQPEKVVEDYQQLARAILNGEVPIEDLCRRERITEKSRQSHHPLYKLATRFQVGDYIMVYRRVDGSLGLLEEYNNDEDRAHYVEKLYKFASRLSDLFEDFDRLFAKPQTLIQEESQPSLF
ncbi:MAG: 3'-5' exonuclease [Fimbriimonadales bacterium]